MHGEVHISVHVCTNDYLRCTKCEVHDRVHKHAIRSTKKRIPIFLILGALKPVVSQLTFLYRDTLRNWQGQFHCNGLPLVDLVQLIQTIFSQLIFHLNHYSWEIDNQLSNTSTYQDVSNSGSVVQKLSLDISQMRSSLKSKYFLEMLGKASLE